MAEYAVTVRGCTKHDDNGGEASDFRYGIDNGSFVPTSSFLHSVDTQKARVIFNEGILEVTFPIVNKNERRHIKLI